MGFLGAEAYTEEKFVWCGLGDLPDPAFERAVDDLDVILELQVLTRRRFLL